MRKRIIGYCASKLYEEDNIRLFGSIHRNAYGKNYGVITYCVAGLCYDKDMCHSTDSLYMINYELLDAMIIDASDFDDRFVAELCEKTSSYNIPTLVIDGYAPNARSITFDTSDAIQRLLVLLDDKKSSSVILLHDNNDKAKETAGSFSAQLMRAGIECETREITDASMNIADTAKKDTVICLNNSWGIVYDLPNVLYIARSEDVVAEAVATEIEGMIACRNNINFDVRKVPYDISENIDFTHNNCDMMRKNYIRSIKALEENHIQDADILSITDDLLKAVSVGEMSDAINRIIPKGVCLCVREMFMQDIFNENMSAYSLKNSKFYILASASDLYKTWGTFYLRELVPDLKQRLEKDVPLIVIPVRYQGVHFGYVVANMVEYMDSCNILEKFVMALDELLGRYINERKLKFASSELFHVTEDMKKMRARDIMTGLYNIHGLVEEMESLKGYCINTGERMLISCIDLDRLCVINDTYGHSEGDIAIQTMAEILKDSVSNRGICAHLGSDEFVVVLHTKDETERTINSYFNALENRIENYNNISEKEYKLEINQVYIDIVPQENMNMRSVVDEAFGKKQSQKTARRKLVSGASDNDEEYMREHERVTELINNNTFKYAYQPIVDAKTGEIYGYEALMRGNDGISPLTILKHAADDDRLYDIEKATFFNVLEQIIDNKDKIGDRKVFINSIPGYQLDSMHYDKFKRKYSEMLGKLVVEVTEQTEMNEEGFGTLRVRSENEGFEVAIDDFGSGYSNTSSLLQCVPDYVKIDRILITGVDSDSRKQYFVKNIIDFAHSNGFLALAEGIENEKELKTVTDMGVDLIQGYYTAKPDFDIQSEINPQIKNTIIMSNHRQE